VITKPVSVRKLRFPLFGTKSMVRQFFADYDQLADPRVLNQFPRRMHYLKFNSDINFAHTFRGPSRQSPSNTLLQGSNDSSGD
jgi:hypothetical protein